MNYTVKAAARATGISESRLRTWERRYGIPKPGRTASGRRLYNEDDLVAIRRMATLVEAGLSAVDAAEAARSGQAAAGEAVPPPSPAHPLIAVIVESAESFDEPGLMGAIDASVEELGWALALDDVLFPALRQIGADWGTAAIPPAKEHFASEIVRRHLAAAIHALGPPSPVAPRLVLACPESERHDLGLLALCLLLRISGITVVYLGADVPTADLIEVQDTLDPAAICITATSDAGLAALIRASRILIARRSIRLFVGGPGVSASGLAPVGLRLPTSIRDAASLIVDRLVEG